MHDTPVSGKQQRAISALLAGQSHQQAAAAAGVSDRALRKWQHQPHFKAELERQRLELAKAGIASLQALTSKSAARLAALLDSEKEGVVLSTAKFVLQMAVATIDQAEILERLEALEQEQESQ
jgi:hypothetical protein